MHFSTGSKLKSLWRFSKVKSAFVLSVKWTNYYMTNLPAHENQHFFGKSKII